MNRLTVLLCLALFTLAATAQRKSKKPSKQASKNDGKIVGGDWAHISEFPFLVSIQHKSGQHFCGGSVISSTFILTAAHCTEGLSPDGIQVVAGTTYLGWETPSQLVEVRSIINHLGYNKDTLDNDIALLRLARPLILGGNVQTIELDQNEFLPWDSLKVAGWGATEEEGQASNTLLQTTVPGVTRDSCRRRYRYISPITENMICAGFPAGRKDACQGDSGGPALSINTRKQVGIVSWGSGCARVDTPGVYTNIARYIPWISSYTDLVSKNNDEEEKQWEIAGLTFV